MGTLGRTESGAQRDGITLLGGFATLCDAPTSAGIITTARSEA
jgi:hypothetical protein